MRVYLQDSEGNEVELEVHQPDPKDGTYILSLPLSSVWLRICSEFEEEQ